MTAPIWARFQAAALCVLCGLQLGCRDKVFEQRFYSGDVTATNLVGYWVVSEDSVNLLKKYGYREHLKRSDHVMLFNADGTCVWRCYDAYYTGWILDARRGPRNVDRHDGFSGESRIPESQISEDAKSWYVWNSSSEQVMRGPWFSTNVVLRPGDMLKKNRWNRCRLVDRRKRGNSYAKRRYVLEFATGGVNGWYGLGNFRMIGWAGGDLVLWSPLIKTTDYEDWRSSDTIRFYRVAADELREIVKKDNGKDTGSP